jgi:hypothetical protein
MTPEEYEVSLLNKEINNKYPNDKDKIIENLKRSNFKLQEENFMLKKEIDFLREEMQVKKIELTKGEN